MVPQRKLISLNMQQIQKWVSHPVKVETTKLTIETTVHHGGKIKPVSIAAGHGVEDSDAK
jgi:hypothetical protein